MEQIKTFTVEYRLSEKQDWYLFANTYRSEFEAYEAVARCSRQYPDCQVKLTVQVIFKQ